MAAAHRIRCIQQEAVVAGGQALVVAMGAVACLSKSIPGLQIIKIRSRVSSVKVG